MKTKEFFAGMKAGMPICIGYFSVSFGFGAMAIAQGLSIWQAVLISASNLTSAGQFAGLTLIVAAASLWEIVLTQLVINSRYGLMSLALSQRLDKNVTILGRMAMAFVNTDEIFALAMTEKEPVTTTFMLGLGSLPVLGWTLGTLSGALAGSVLPQNIRTALGVMLYGMFIAIVVPPAKQDKSVLITVGAAMALSCLFAWAPVLNTVSPGIAIVVCTVAAAAICAWKFPIEEDAA
jgi:predicted branched-subunit amino acid permease